MGSIAIFKQVSYEASFGWQALHLCERVAAALVLLVLAPVMLIAGVAIVTLSGRTPLIAHRRVGRQGSALWVLKLRTMWDDTRPGRQPSRLVERIEDEAGPRLKSAADARVTHGFARFCRRHSIDELPQLWHVVVGEMALVGPRPLTAAELDRHYGRAAEEILQAKPGLAGLWQVSGRNRLTYEERRRLDLAMVRNRSLRLYLKILLRTFPEIWHGANTW